MKNLSPRGQALGLRIHAVAFVFVMLLLVVINWLIGPPYWVLWVLPWWSIGLLSHWLFVLGPGARWKRSTHEPTTNWNEHPRERSSRDE